MSECIFFESVPPIIEAISERNVYKLNEAIKRGENPNFYYGDTLETPLHLACKLGCVNIVEILIKQDANTNSRNIFRNTPLHIAASNGNKKIVDFLLAAGANIGAKNIWNQTPMLKAAQIGSTAVVSSLLKVEDQISFEWHEESPMKIAAEREHFHILQAMLDPQAGPHTKISEMDLYTALKIAASKGNLPIVKLLISRGAPVNYPDEPGSTTPLRAAVLSRSLEVVNLLIAKGAKMNDTNDENETLLLKATNSGLWDIAEKILRKDAEVDELSQVWKMPNEANNAHICKRFFNKVKFDHLNRHQPHSYARQSAERQCRTMRAGQ